LPVPQRPHEPGFLEQLSPAPAPETLEAKTERFFVNFVDPQWGHFVPFQSLDRTRISLSRSHPPQ